MTARVVFRQSDITRAMQGAKKAGFAPTECLIDPATGAIRLVFGETPVAGLANPLDRLLGNDA